MEEKMLAGKNLSSRQVAVQLSVGSIYSEANLILVTKPSSTLPKLSQYTKHPTFRGCYQFANSALSLFFVLHLPCLSL